MPLQLWVSALEIGLVLGLLGLAYLVVLQGAGFFHFAIGPIAMFSAMQAATASADYHLVVAVATGVVAAVALAVGSEVGVVRPIQRRAAGAELPALVAVIAVLFAIEQLAGYLYGYRPVPGRPWWQGPAFEVAGAFVARHSVVLLVATLAVFAGVWTWTRFAGYGRMLRAVGDNPGAANLLGLPVNRVRIVAFGLAGVIAGLAGPLAAVKSGVSFHSGLWFALSGFLALVVGGTGSIWGPLAGGMLVALLQMTASYYLGGSAVDYAMVALAILFFAVRPQGLFHKRVRV